MTSGSGDGEREMKVQSYQPFDLHKQLAFLVKSSLKGCRKDPAIRIEMPFDLVVFNGGLWFCGKHRVTTRGHEVFGLNHYADLKPLLGEKRRDFCYVKLQTVEYWVYKRKDIEEFDEEGNPMYLNGGYVLVFRFVRMDKVQTFLNSILQIK